MIQGNELIMLLLAIGCAAFIVVNRKKVHRIPEAGTLLSAFGILLAGYGLTILEGLLWKEALNMVEHVCYAASSVLMTVWCWKIFAGKRDAS
jgi:hypothetical protein